MYRAHKGMCLAPLVLMAACDVVVDPGQTTMLGNRGAVFAVNTPNAVTVRPGGTLVVEDADLFGLGRIVEQGDRLRSSPGAAIVSSGGVVRLLGGTVSGGNVLVVPQDPSTPPVAPGSAPLPLPVASALVAQSSLVEIDGANLVSSGVFGLSSFVPAPVVSATSSDVRIRSGALRVGPMTDPSPFFLAWITLQAFDSRVEIGGGDFVGGRVLLGSSRTHITGGQVGSMSVGIDVALLNPVPLPGPGCTELRGGSPQVVSVDGPAETLFIFGTRFNLPLGAVPVPRLATRGFGPGPPVPTARLTGTLADGTPLDLQLFVFDAAARVVLAAPGSTGCPA